MRALTVEPGRVGTVEVTEVAEPDSSAGALLVQGLALGVCGTDKEIARSPPAATT